MSSKKTLTLTAFIAASLLALGGLNDSYASGSEGGGGGAGGGSAAGSGGGGYGGGSATAVDTDEDSEDRADFRRKRQAEKSDEAAPESDSTDKE